MSRKALGHWPVVEFDMAPKGAFGTAGTFTEQQAQDALQEALQETRLLLGKALGRDYLLDFSWRIQSDYSCEHCNARWTEKSPDYNGGCCDKDEANNPESVRGEAA